MPINPYINFNGNCREAVEFYARVFRTAPPKFMTFGEMPSDPSSPVPDQARDRIMHTQVEIAGTPVMFSDTFPGMDFVVGNNVSLAVVTPDREEILRAYNELKQDGSVQMELQETFWSKLYGIVKDKCKEENNHRAECNNNRFSEFK